MRWPFGPPHLTLKPSKKKQNKQKKNKKIVFSGKHSFSKTQLVKPTFSTMSKNTFFKKKVSFLLFDNFR